jgi:hypothetical protein
MNRLRRVILTLDVILMLACAVLSTACSDSTGPDGDRAPSEVDSFEWSGQVATGGTVEIKNINGSIRATPAPGGLVLVKALKRGGSDDPSSVRIDVVQHQGGVTICAVYPDVPGQPANECLPGFLNGQFSSRNSDVEVRFDVQVPVGSDFAGGTIGGHVEARGLHGNVDARTLAGDIDISTTGLASGTTLKGDVTASIGQADWDRDLRFSSVDGNVTVRIPTNTNARVSGIANGSISTDFPLTITSQGSFRQLSGILGSGGRNLTLSTSDGNIALRRN